MNEFVFHFNCGCIIGACCQGEHASHVDACFGALAVAHKANREHHPAHVDTRAHAYEHRGYLIFMN